MCKATNSITIKVNELVSLNTMLDDLKAEIAALEDEIKAYMDEQEAISMEAGLHVVTYKEVTSKRIDTTGLKKLLGAEALEPYTKLVTTKRFQVK